MIQSRTVISFSDKDIQLIRKTYCRLTELYYENPTNEAVAQDLIQLGNLITQTVSNPRQAAVLALLPIIEPLKIKAKAHPRLLQHIEQIVSHLKGPSEQQVSFPSLLYSLQKSDLFVVGCTIAIRFYDRLQGNSSEFSWKDIIAELASNIAISPALCIELTYLICRENEVHSRVAVKSGLVKFVFLSYVASTIDNRYHLYKAIKLLKVVASADATLLRDKEKGLALAIYVYDDYVPVVEGILGKCYDQDYCQSIDACKHDLNTLDQTYLWSHLALFCLNNLSSKAIDSLSAQLTKPLTEVEEKKILGILANHSKFKKHIPKQVLKTQPKCQTALLNYIKLCVNCCQLDPDSGNCIDLVSLKELADKSQNSKVGDLYKYLQELSCKDRSKTGMLSEDYKKMFDMERNADFMMERAARVPQNNEELVDIRQILKEKDRGNEFESDTLTTVKEKCLNSLHTAIMQNRKLDLNLVLKEVDLGDVSLLARLLNILELSLTINEELVAGIDLGRVLQIIGWVENNCRGEMIDWGSISQLVVILTEEGAWKGHFHEIPEQCFWLLNVQVPTEQDEDLIWQHLASIPSDSMQSKIPFLVGFITRGLMNDGKLRLYHGFRPLFAQLAANLGSSTIQLYKISLIMLSTFIKNWHEQGDHSEDSLPENQQFEAIISPLVKQVLHNFRGLDQEYEFLENCLPFDFDCSLLTDNIDYLINLYGKLASYIYKQTQLKAAKTPGQKVTVNYDRIKALSTLPPESSRNIIQILNFLADNSQLLQTNQLSLMLAKLMNKRHVYWFVYPQFYNILSRVISILTSSSSLVILQHFSSLLHNIITFISNNPDISPDERTDLLDEVKICLETSAAKGTPLDKDKLKQAIDRITDKALKEQLLFILGKYVVKETAEKKVVAPVSGSVTDSVLFPALVQLAQETMEGKEQEQGQSDKKGKQGKQETSITIDNLDDIDNTNLEEMEVIEALRVLKKIIEGKEAAASFAKLYTVFQKESIRAEHTDILGHLLALFYPGRDPKMQGQAIELFENKLKTRLSRESCYQLLSQHPETFCLSKRWRLIGEEWVDLAMKRFTEGHFADASQVAEQNLTTTEELEYFLCKKYDELICACYPQLCSEQDHASVLMLIGTSARNSKIKSHFYKQGLHIKILELMETYPNNGKVFANLLYSLSSLVYVQPEVCADLVKHKPELKRILGQLKYQSNNRCIVESGACLMANLSFSNEAIKEALQQLQVIPIFVFLFESVLDSDEISTFKQIIRVFGNLSLSTKCAHELIDLQFCALAVRMVDSIDISVNVPGKVAILKILVDLLANLASHRYKHEIFHQQKVTNLMLNLLETIQTHIPILTACIDIIDCLCQNPQIENYVVIEKQISFILIDILKTQTDEKIMVKSTRLLTNLTINPACIPHILRASLLSVLANIVMPQFYGNKAAAEHSKKMQTYILKIISRIYHSKPDRYTILKSGYLDCLVRTIETSDHIEDAYIELLYYYSDMMPNFLNKRAFLCLNKILVKKISNKEVASKCLRSIKKLSTLYERDEEDVLVPGTNGMYEQLLGSEMRDEGLELLCYHLFRSGKLRQYLGQVNTKVLEIVRKIGESSKYLEICKEIVFLIHNPYVVLEDHEETEQQGKIEQLKKGFKCKLFRIDGSSKRAVIDMNEEYEIRCYKYPDGEVKHKYIADIRSIKDFQFNYQDNDQLWHSSVFCQEKGLFDSTTSQPRHSCTLISSKRWGIVSFINLEFDSEPDKHRFMVCLRTVYNSLR